MIEFFDGGITSVPGFRAAGVRAGIKRRGLDLMLIHCVDGPVPAAGAFTTNRVKGAPVLVTQRHLKDGRLGAIVANSGNANVFTGERGIRDAETMASVTAKLLGLRASDVAVASTGVIGRYLPMRLIERGIRLAVRELSDSREAGLNAARAIMTTDTRPKEVALRVRLADETTVTIAGIAKGSGMICPQLSTATTLVFLATDAAITPNALRQSLKRALDKSLNMLNIDNETSTSDMVLIMANGRASNRRITIRNFDPAFLRGLECALVELTKMLARDGEGATKLIEVRVNGAHSQREAKKVARVIVGSSLVKSAIFGGDPNWGRIVAAVGYSGVRFDPKKARVGLSDKRSSVLLVRGEKPPSQQLLRRARELLKSDHVIIDVHLGVGKYGAVAWGCDLTYDYVKINSRYTT
jgi:glutamate N-acetyltransferase/amino-acid N-acetyltransferase